MEDPVKVQQKINELNELGGNWIANKGYFAVTGFDFNNGKPIFSPSLGIPVKVFNNTITGEVKIFLATGFERDRT